MNKIGHFRRKVNHSAASLLDVRISPIKLTLNQKYSFIVRF
ncbi:hypothetical protein [Bacillus altitudinis]|nr:hypothetical protein [Bacillus altitudinis]